MNQTNRRSHRGFFEMNTARTKFLSNLGLKACLSVLFVILHLPQTLLAFDCRPYEYPKVEGSAPEDLPDAPSFLLEVKGPGVPASYIFGTFHSADPRVLTKWKKIPLLMAASKTRVLITERSFGSDSSLGMDARLLPKERSLKGLLKDEGDLYDRIVQALKGYNLPYYRADEFKPWFASALINQGPAMQSKENKAHLDEYLYREAKRMNIAIDALESMDELASYHDNYLSLTDQIRLLGEAVCNQQTNEEHVQRQTEAYIKDDVAGMYEIMGEYEPTDPTLGDKLFEVFVKERNKIFWEKIWEQLRKGGAFVAVGNLHVFGENGIWDKLRDVADQQELTVQMVNLEDMMFELAVNEVNLDWILDWAKDDVKAKVSRDVFDGLQIKYKSIPELRKMLCPGKRCEVEATYVPTQKTIYLTSGIFARVMMSKATPEFYVEGVNVKKRNDVLNDVYSADIVYADSILIRELARHVLYQTRYDKLKEKHEKLKNENRNPEEQAFLEGCIRNRILYLASSAQQKYVRAKKAFKRVHLFRINSQCEKLDAQLATRL